MKGFPARVADRLREAGERPRTPLRFTKTAEPRVERIYARPFVGPGKGPFHAPRSRCSARTGLSAALSIGRLPRRA